MAAFQTLQIIGAASFLSYGLARLAVRSGWFRFHRYAIIAIPRAALPVMPRGYSVRPLCLADLADHPIDADAQVQAQRFDQGLSCLGAFNAREKLVGVIWLGGGGGYDEDEVQLRFAFDENCCWDTGLWIDPQYRLSRAFPALWAGAARWMKAHGHDWSLSRIADYNIVSLLPHRRLQSSTLGHVSTLWLGRWQWCWHGRPRLLRPDSGRRSIVALSPPDGER